MSFNEYELDLLITSCQRCADYMDSYGGPFQTKGYWNAPYDIKPHVFLEERNSSYSGSWNDDINDFLEDHFPGWSDLGEGARDYESHCPLLLKKVFEDYRRSRYGSD